MAKIRDNSGYGSGVIAEESAGIEIRSDDPTLSEGLVWYNTTANTLKVARLQLTAGTWSTGGVIGTARRTLAGAGTLTAGLCAGGRATGTVTTSEVYDGSSWATGNALPTATKQFDGCGTQTAALTAGGDQ